MRAAMAVVSVLTLGSGAFGVSGMAMITAEARWRGRRRASDSSGRVGGGLAAAAAGQGARG